MRRINVIRTSEGKEDSYYLLTPRNVVFTWGY